MAEAPPARQEMAPPTAGADLSEMLKQTLEIPDRLGKYRVLGELGEGGMSVVYLAMDDALERKVAVKLLHRHLARDPEARARLSREARACARLTHAHIPEIYDFSGASGHDDGRSYIVSEFVDGAPLSEVLRLNPPRLPEVGVLLVLGIARALAHAHAHGVIHRDVKPENALVGRDGAVKLTDFGIAHVIGLESMTMTGTLIGSPQHMAPEQIDATADMDHRVDVWAFGTVLFMAVAGGRPPFEGDNPHRLLRRILEGDRPDIRRLNPHTDAALAAIIDGCLTLDRNERIASMGEVLTRLEAWLAPRGLPDTRAELRAFMSDPAGYERLLEPRLVEPLLGMAETALQAGRTHAALEPLGRVLLLSPGHPVATARLRRIERRHRHRRVLVLAGAGAALVSAVALTVAAWPAAEPWSFPLAPASVAETDRAEPPPTEAAELDTVAAAPGSAEPAASAPPDQRAPEDTPAVTPEAEAETDPAEVTAPMEVEAAEPPSELSPPPSATTPPRPPPRAPAPARRPEPVETRLTVFPPAVRLTLDGRPVAAGQTQPLAPGTYAVVLTHPGCPECGQDRRRLVVPDNHEGILSQHFVFERVPTSFEPASLFVHCPSGGWVESDAGTRYACNAEHRLDVTSDKPTLLVLTAFDAAGKRLDTRRFTIRPKAPIVWRL